MYLGRHSETAIGVPLGSPGGPGICWLLGNRRPGLQFALTGKINDP
jgi:hypothetical protein